MLIEIDDDHVLTLEDMDQDQLELAECHLQSQVDHISHQLKFNKDGDEEWIESANYALIMFNKQLRYVKLHLKRLRTVRNQREELKNRLIDHLKTLMTEQEFYDLKENLKHG